MAEKVFSSDLSGDQSGSANWAPVVAAAADTAVTAVSAACAAVPAVTAVSAISAVEAAAAALSLPGCSCAAFDPHAESRSPAHRDAVMSVRQIMGIRLLNLLFSVIIIPR